MVLSLEDWLKQLPGELSLVVDDYWRARARQQQKQLDREIVDQGARGAVTGGAQMNGFIALFSRIIADAGIAPSCIHTHTALELPGFFRPTKKWDLVVVQEEQLLAAIEVKSQAGPSFANNFNNRTEEAMGSALDLWTAYREGAFKKSVAPFVGYFFLLEEAAGSRKPIHINKPHFPVFSEFENSSYVTRYELFCRKLMLERHYTGTAFVTSERSGPFITYREPADDLRVERFVRLLYSHIAATGCS